MNVPLYSFTSVLMYEMKKVPKSGETKGKRLSKGPNLTHFLWYQSCLSKVYESRFQKWKLIFDVLQEDDASAGIFSTHIWV